MSQKKSGHVSIMGPDIDHKHSLMAMLESNGVSCSWFPDSHSQLNGQPQTLFGKIQRSIDQLSYTHNKAFITDADHDIQRHQPKVLIAYWGTTPLADIIAVKRRHKDLKIMLMVLCYPVALTHFGVAKQNWMMRHAAPWIDVILVPNTEMAEYFRDSVVPRDARDKVAILPPGWPRRYQPTTPQAAVSERPNIVFVGRTDLSHHTVHVADDLRPLMHQILEAGIELHHVRSKETDDGHPLRRMFAPLKQTELLARMSAFDASLIAYNTDACQRPDRFALTVPDRLLSTVASGCPIAIPKKGYQGCKSYLANYPAVFEFEDAVHLYKLLSDRERVKEAKAAAWEYRTRYSSEAFGGQLISIINKLS